MLLRVSCFVLDFLYCISDEVAPFIIISVLCTCTITNLSVPAPLTLRSTSPVSCEDTRLEEAFKNVEFVYVMGVTRPHPHKISQDTHLDQIF